MARQGRSGCNRGRLRSTRVGPAPVGPLQAPTVVKTAKKPSHLRAAAATTAAPTVPAAQDRPHREAGGLLAEISSGLAAGNDLHDLLRAALLHERQAIAAELHDSIGQSLAFVKMRLPLLHDAIEAGDAHEVQRYFGDVRQAVSQAHVSLRGILSQFRAPPDPLGLAHALEVSAFMFRQTCTARLAVHDELPAGRLSPAQGHQVAQVVQEALLNVARHAQARQAWVHLRAAPEARIEVLVQDDGVGVPPQDTGGAAAAHAQVAKGAHYGLDIMRERARRLGGTLSVSARAGGGTSVRLLFAVSPPAAQAAAGAGAELHG